MDGAVFPGFCDVLLIHLHGHPLANQRPDAVHTRLGLHRIRHNARLRDVPQRIRVLPDFRRHHPRQDGSAFHRRTIGHSNAGGSIHQLVCRDRDIHGQQP